MHDYFEILGVPPDARAQDIRRAVRRRTRPGHPDVRDGEVSDEPVPVSHGRDVSRDLAPEVDVAIDFVDMTTIVDRMQSAFFGSSR